MTISIVIPCCNEENYIEGCIRSLQDQRHDDFSLEIIVVDGNSTDRTLSICQDLRQEYANLVIVNNPKRFTPFGLNIGVRAATGDYVLICSAHASFSQDYIARLLSARASLDADIVGGVMHTDVKNHTPKALAICEVLSSRIGVGNAMFRIGVQEPQAVDTVPFGLYPRAVFDEVGYYDERLIRNHDIELSKRLIAHGKRIYLVPSAQCTYFARETFAGLAANNYRNGLWNLLTVRITRCFRSLSLRHFIPLAFLLSLVLPLLLALLFHPFVWLSVLSAVAYMMAVGAVCIKTSVTRRLNVFYLLAAFPVLHLSYAAGSLVGMFKPIGKR